MDRTIYVEPERCLGCSSCELACAVAHSQSGELFQAILENLLPESRLQVCPTGAMARTEPGEPVICDQERCVGCSLCVLACPYGVLRLDRTGDKVLKCDLCVDRLEQGLEPACAEACPSSAIQFLSLDEIDQHEGDRWQAVPSNGREFLIVYRGWEALGPPQRVAPSQAGGQSGADDNH